MHGRYDDPFGGLQEDGDEESRARGEAEVGAGSERHEVPEREGEDHHRHAQPADEPTGEEGLDEQGDDRAARVDRGVEERVVVLRGLQRPGLRRGVQTGGEQVVGDLHEEVPEEDVDPERAEEPVAGDELVAVERPGEALAHRPLGPVHGDRALTLRQMPAEDEQDHERQRESHGFDGHERLRVDDRGEPGREEAADDLADQEGAGEEREDALALLGVEEVARVDPEDEVDGVLHHLGDDVGEPEVDRGQRERDLRHDREHRDEAHVPNEEIAPAHAADEREDDARGHEQDDGRQDVRDREISDPDVLDEDRVRADLPDPVRDHGDRQERVQQEHDASLFAAHRDETPQPVHPVTSAGWATRFAAGIVNSTMAPGWPPFAMPILPPCSSTASLQKASPSPVPPRLRPESV